MVRSELTQAFYPLRTRADRRMDLEKGVNERIPENLYYGEFNFLDNKIEFVYTYKQVAIFPLFVHMYMMVYGRQKFTLA